MITKKLLSLLLAIALILSALSIMPLTVFAETSDDYAYVDTNPPRIEFEYDRAVLGGNVNVQVKVKNNPGISSLKLDVNYDDDLILKNVEYNAEIGGMSQEPYTNESPVKLNWVSDLQNITGDFVLATITFKVKSDAGLGIKNIDADYNPDDIFNIDEANVAFSVVGGEIDVKEYKPGDINDDDAVNNKDLLRLFKYLSNWTVDVNEAALDINNDGKVNNKDLVRLFKYLSGWDVKISFESGNNTTDFLWPVAGYYTVSSPFGQRPTVFHTGMDISGGGIAGSPILAIADGVVYMAEDSWSASMGKSGVSGYGNYCAINHGDITINGSSAQYVAFYAHAASIIVSVGQTVKQGQVLGYVGSTGNATGPHLHIGIQKDGTWVNPYPLLHS